MPDGVIYKPCGNRRATTCPGCAETYRRDAYHLIRAGLTGGKGVPPTSPPTPPSSPPSPLRRSARSTPGRSASTPAPTRPSAPAGPNPATPAATQHLPARPAAACFARHSRAIPGSASRCARTATTTPATSCGITSPASCGGAPSKPSNAGSASSPAAAASPRSRSPAATAGTAWWTRSASRTARPPNTRPAARSTSTPAAPRRLRPRHPDELLPPPPGHHRRRPPRRRHRAAGRSAASPRRTRLTRRLAHRLGHPIDGRDITMTGTGDRHRPGRRQLPRQVLHQRHRDHRARLRPRRPDTIGLYANPAGTHPERLIDACWQHRPPPRPTPPVPLGPHARLRRPLPHQSPPLLRHLP